MNILFLILGHSQLRSVVKLTENLIQGANNNYVAIHYDANSSLHDFSLIRSQLQQRNRVHLVDNRIKCRWGSFSLVEAVVASLNELETRYGLQSYDYIFLLSETCLPNRPLHQLYRYLLENKGTQFIEVADERWVKDGLRSERYKFYFPFSPSKENSFLQKNLVRLQRFSGIKRRVPQGLDIRFGSQWWALTGEMCRGIIDYLNDNPKLATFFRKTYIPDEMVFPTLVNHLDKAQSIAGFNLTAYQFDDNGKPTMYGNSDIEKIMNLKSFFFRKASPGAEILREACFAVALGKDDGRDLSIMSFSKPNSFVSGD
ncbi:beta-1,6-N-acetylglucosaminyltransferase [Brucella sp. H1_1004]|uniref:beta-1,6-N-acetylglucosaminyltransferase n=1 Tax=Brucella sp. H1_1004 TaxID=3110109 RepID=UPI0039B4F668